jgi:hypothetical protein
MDICLVVFRFIASVDFVLVVYIVCKINQSNYRPNYASDSIGLAWYRNIGFGMMATMLVLALVEDASREALLRLFYSASYSIAINAGALHLRK